MTNPVCEYTTEGLLEIVEAQKEILDYSEVGLGTFDEDGEIVEASWPNYERAILMTSIVTLSDGTPALAADVQFSGPDSGYGEFNAVFVALGSTIQGKGRWEEIQRLPATVIGRWRLTFRP